MVTADGMEGVAETQDTNAKATGTLTKDFLSAFYATTLRELSSPELWAGAVAGFVAGTAVGFAANKAWKRIKKGV